MIASNRVFAYRDCVFSCYDCADPQEVLPLHSHEFEHLTVVTSGKIRIGDGATKILDLVPGDEPVLFPAGQLHSISTLAPNTSFINISPRSP